MVSKKIVSQSVTIMACALAAFLIGASMVTIHTDDKKMAQNNASTVRVYAVEPYQVKPGEPITIIGQGFEVSNTVHFGDMLHRTLRRLF